MTTLRSFECWLRPTLIDLPTKGIIRQTEPLGEHPNCRGKHGPAIGRDDAREGLRQSLWFRRWESWGNGSACDEGALRGDRELHNDAPALRPTPLREAYATILRNILLFRAHSMILYALTVFVSSFLLFLVQPLIAKQVLPWFGGTASVWTTCLVFFQSALLAGYFYSDWISRRLCPRRQAALHLVLIIVAVLLLPIIPDASWKPSGDEAPSLRIILLLTATIGLPYFLLSTTSPLVQAWFARSYPDSSPYRLFALSNLASMIALLGYPLLLEPNLATKSQAWVWSIGFVLFAILVVGAARFALKSAAPSPSLSARSSADVERTSGPQALASPPSSQDKTLWILLSALGSVMLLAISNHLTQNISSIPLLWVVPLALYLLTFILCFDGSGWYRRGLMLPLLGAVVVAIGYTLTTAGLEYQLHWQISVFCLGLFVACMFCHGELAARKPHVRYLTTFYLMISTGGALGAFLVGILAPVLLPAYFELELGIVAIAAVATYSIWELARKYSMRWRVFAVGAGVIVTMASVAFGVRAVQRYQVDVVYYTRNFYGALRVKEFLPPAVEDAKRTLVHGSIKHGDQYLDPRYSIASTTYYTINSGVGLAIDLKAQLAPGAPRRIGVVGLGAGTLASYGLSPDAFRFYEINAEVIDIANRYFTYLKQTRAKVEMALGDARLNLEREPSQQFDVLAVDAFSGDAIPVHLMTQEALDIYARHMKPDGVIAFHVSNRYLDLKPVLARLAETRGFNMAWVRDADSRGATISDWILLTKDAAFLAHPKVANRTTAIPPLRTRRVWTDDFNNLLQLLQ